MFAGLELLSWIFSPAMGETPSRGWVIWILTPVFLGSMIFRVLLGGAKMAWERSLPTFRWSMSNPATKRMSEMVYFPTLGCVSPMGLVRVLR